MRKIRIAPLARDTILSIVLAIGALFGASVAVPGHGASVASAAGPQISVAQGCCYSWNPYGFTVFVRGTGFSSGGTVKIVEKDQFGSIISTYYVTASDACDVDPNCGTGWYNQVGEFWTAWDEANSVCAPAQWSVTAYDVITGVQSNTALFQAPIAC